ncbi:ABC transporter substrate-binding protein [Desulfosediminicola flagellatus]|uniref:ABC transporter substrate-binding protein n=1 Tax=Desulfosediminicola flagellatus TaxID=2569541 RepID=UPI00142EB411|nr:ABC transporter substrate-binding protein [Desulfosediminicola flagellatus]
MHLLPKIVYCVFLIQLMIGCNRPSETEQENDTNGISGTGILLGTSLAQSGHAGFLGTQYLHGAQAYFFAVNEDGGIWDRKIHIIAYDDQYEPIRTVTNTQQLIYTDNVFALFNYVGTPTSLAVRKIIESAKIPAFGFLTGAESLRQPFSSYLFHLRDSYNAEAEGAISYYVDILELKRIGVLYQDDEFGLSVLIGIQKALQKRGLQPVVTDTYPRGSLDLKESLDYIHQAELDVIMLVGTSGPLASFIKQTHQRNVYPHFGTVSFVGSADFAHEINVVHRVSHTQNEKIMITQVVPSPLSAHIKSVIEYLQISARYFPEDPPNYVALEGFLNAKVLTYALQQAGRNLTRSKLLTTLEQLHDFDIGIGKMLSFTETDHQGIKGIYYSYLSQYDRFEMFDPKEKTLK